MHQRGLQTLRSLWTCSTCLVAAEGATFVESGKQSASADAVIALPLPLPLPSFKKQQQQKETTPSAATHVCVIAISYVICVSGFRGLSKPSYHTFPWRWTGMRW